MSSVSKDLTGCHILLIGIGFYDYEQAIADELHRQGAIVFQYDELPTYLRRGVIASLVRRFKIDISNLVRAHQKRILDDISGRNIDHVLVIKGEHIASWFLDELKSVHSEAQLISYHWDSLKRYPHLLSLQSCFDKVYTFDYIDAKSFPRFRLRPLFFRPEIASNITSPSVEAQDLTFVGWLHHERLSQINEIYQWAGRHGFRTFFYLYTGWFSIIKLRLRGNAKFVSSLIMEYKEYVSLLHASRIIVDLPHPDQAGLTMRAIEALGAGKKLITTSLHISKCEFYDPNNIFIIDSKNINIDISFMETEYRKPSQKIIEKYSLTSWVKEIFER
jgi:hypothetical protein